MRTRMIHRICSIVLGSVLCASALSVSSSASADPTCNTLLTNIRSWLTARTGNTVSMIHTTNFLVNDGTTFSFWGGFAGLNIVLNGNGHLIGASNRLISNRVTSATPPQPFDIHQPDPISYDIDLSGKVTFDGVFGPADPVCFFDKFMVLPGATAVEVFSFVLKSPVGG